MPNITRKEAVLILASLVLIAVIGTIAYQSTKPQQQRPTDTGRINFGPGVESQILPVDLPVPVDATVTQGFDLASKTGDLQGTRSYDSSRSLGEEANAYEDYMKKNGWTIIDRKEAPGYAAMLAEKEGKQLLASFSASEGKTAVTVSALSAPANY